MNIKLFAKKAVLFFVVAIFIYTLLSVLVSAMPNELVEENANLSLSILEEEGNYPKYFFSSNASILDNFTDIRMIQAALTDEESSIVQNAMLINGRIQYWQGYLIFLKLLLIFFQIYQIRYILYFTFFLLFLITAALIYKKMDFPTLFAFAAGVIATNVLFVSVSLQYIGAYFIMLISIIILLTCKERLVDQLDSALLFFLAVGSFTCFIDFLTAPVITLGVPLMLYILLSGNRLPRLRQFVHTVSISASWAIGYALTFVSKWAIASILLQTNAFASAINQLSFRMNGSEEYVVQRSETLQKNFSLIVGFNCFSLTEILGALVIFALIIAVFLFIYRKKALPSCKVLFQRTWFSDFMLLMVGLYPYLWYIVFANHSTIHYWMTYRDQLLTVFAVVYVVVSYLYCAFRTIRTPAVSSPSDTQFPTETQLHT